MSLFRYALYILIFLILSLTVLFVGLCVAVDRQGSVDQARSADCIVVLGARVLPDGRPSEDLFVRTQHAVELYRQGIAHTIICTGGFANEARSAAAVARSVAIASGVPAEDIYLADGSNTTQEDAEQTAHVMRTHGWKTAVLVSHPLHLLRCKLLFEAQGVTVYTSPTNTQLSVIKPQWRIIYDVREALFIFWSSIEQFGFPRSLGYTIQNHLYDWSEWLRTAWNSDTGTS